MHRKGESQLLTNQIPDTSNNGHTFSCGLAAKKYIYNVVVVVLVVVVVVHPMTSIFM